MNDFKLMSVSVALACALPCACGSKGSGGGGGGTLSIATSSLTFIANGPSDATPPPQVVSGSVTGGSGGTLYVTISGTGQAIASISPFTILNNTTGQCAVSVPPPSSLGVGTYTGLITVRACKDDPTCASGQLNGSPRTIRVTYHVAALQSSVAALDYTVTNSPVASDLTRQVTITGTPPQHWLASTTANWLTVTGTGNSGAAMNVTLKQSVVDTLVNGTYAGSITLTPGTAGQPLVIPVILIVKRTQINYVSPYVAYTGTSGDVIIRGEEFSQVAIQNVLFGATPAQSFTVVSPTEIHATYPSTLPRGRYTVQLQSSFANVRQFADLVVVDTPAFSAAVLAYPDTRERTVDAIVYDAERAALGVSVWCPFSGATELVRFPSAANVWQAPTAKPLTNSFGLALSADGTQWIAGAGQSVMHIRADDLATITTVHSPLLYSGGRLQVAEMAVANDGTVAMFGDVYFGCDAALMLYDVRKQTFTMPGYTACRGDIGASGDGSRLLIPNEFIFSSDDVFSLDTSTGTTTPTGIHLLTGAQPVLNRTGSRIVLNKTRVYDGAYTYLGDLPATTAAVVLSPDGTRAYAYDSSGLLLTYDLASGPVSVSGIYQQIGKGITLAGDPGPIWPPSNVSPLFAAAIVMMSITPDGGTVFIAGSKAVVVQPIP